jgi:hypothetical protein
MTTKDGLPQRKKKTENWTPDYVTQFRKDYPSFTDKELCSMYQTNPLKVQQLAIQFCLGKNKLVLPGTVKMPRWTESQLVTLKKLYSSNDNLIIAKKLSRTVKSVVSKAFFMKLKKNATQLTKTAKENVSCRSINRNRVLINRRKKANI